MNPETGPLLLYGGTFDPVHCGHVAIARAAADALGIEQALVIPAGTPPHRAAPVASAALRTEMLQQAFAADPRFRIDLRELQRSAPSYTVDTLSDLRHEFGQQRPLVLLLGADAFLGLPSWHRWEQIPKLAHVAVIARPGLRLQHAAEIWPGTMADPSNDPAPLRTQPAGVCVVLPVPLSAVSSTEVRAAFAGGDQRPPGIPAAVADLLQRRGNPYFSPPDLSQPDLSQPDLSQPDLPHPDLPRSGAVGRGDSS